MWNRDHPIKPGSSSPRRVPSTARTGQQHGSDAGAGWQDRPESPDAVEGFPGDDSGWDADDSGDAISDVPASLLHTWPAAQARQILREFLRAVPRAEPVATLALTRPDGSIVVVTRAQLTAAIDALRPRQRQVVRLTLEEGWTRQRVCDYLHISLKTLIRDQAEALDALTQL